MLPHLVCLLLYVTQTIHNTFQVSLTKKPEWRMDVSPLSLSLCNSFKLLQILQSFDSHSTVFEWGKGYILLVLDPPPPLLFLKEGVNFHSIPSRGEGSQKLKRGWKYGAGAGLLKGGWGWHFSYLVFPRFIIFTFRNYFTLCKILSYIWGKIIFFCHHNFRKKGHSKVSRNEPENIP